MKFGKIKEIYSERRLPWNHATSTFDRGMSSRVEVFSPGPISNSSPVENGEEAMWFSGRQRIKVVDSKSERNKGGLHGGDVFAGVCGKQF